MCGLLNDRGARVIILVHAVSEAHEPHAGFLVLHPVHKVGGIAALSVNLVQHFQHSLVGTTVERARQCVDAGCHRHKHVGLRGGDHTHRGGGAVLLVVGVQDEQLVKGFDQERINVIWLCGEAEHHAQEVFPRIEGVIGVHVGLAFAGAVCVGRKHGHLGEKSCGGQVEVFLVKGAEFVLVVGGQNINGGGQHGHGVRVAWEDSELCFEVFVQQGVVADRVVEAQ